MNAPIATATNAKLMTIVARNWKAVPPSSEIHHFCGARKGSDYDSEDAVQRNLPKC